MNDERQQRWHKEERWRSQDGHAIWSLNLKTEAVGLPSGWLWPLASKAHLFEC